MLFRSGQDGIEVLNVFAPRDELSPRSQHSRAGNAACIDCVAQLGVAVNSRVTQVANRGDTALQVFSCRLCAHQNALARRFNDGQQQAGGASGTHKRDGEVVDAEFEDVN